MLEQLTHRDFDEKVTKSNGKVLVEFFATWCPHCKHEQSVMDELGIEENGSVPVYQIDVDQEPRLAELYAPNGVPTYVLFDNGVAARTLSGEQSLDDLLRFVA